MADSSKYWLKQAERNLAQAEDSAASDRHEWACFAAQQAAELGIKALHLFFKQEAWGHVVRNLFEELGDLVEVPDDLLKKAQVLDTFYIPTRYPSSHAAGAPYEHYNSIQSSEAIKYASEIIEFVRSKMA